MCNSIKSSTLDRQAFNEWFNDGNAVKVGVDKYLEQTTQYRTTFTLRELELFFIREYQIQ
ncbi:hypothetical protein HYO65_gp201 [Tenacibaculum phage PTm1]|uniref:Uncharacterized protein n=2 Tax=Shirahamavirus PTm1 TaxID=2846435 RepID=A0A5S9C139_9CAUD|nr:hypothetical protein HYO65_gp201 [Tenacibaculum phage PTm1]BBI90593.1 hypothetical protein [Tenacibaculum phage PTm1]BBI90901.1 hypothetical protein [Tenacibaculum phage PTm5]